MDRKYDVKEAFMSLDRARCSGTSNGVFPPPPHRAILGPAFHYSTPRDFNFRCSADRSMPMNSAVRDMLPPNRLI